MCVTPEGARVGRGVAVSRVDTIDQTLAGSFGRMCVGVGKNIVRHLRRPFLMSEHVS